MARVHVNQAFLFGASDSGAFDVQFTVTKRLTADEEQEVTCTEFQPNHETYAVVAAVSNSSRIYVVHDDDGVVRHCSFKTASIGSDAVTGVSFSDHGGYFVAANASGNMGVYRVGDGNNFSRILVAEGEVRSCKECVCSSLGFFAHGSNSSNVNRQSSRRRGTRKSSTSRAS